MGFKRAPAAFGWFLNIKQPLNAFYCLKGIKQHSQYALNKYKKGIACRSV